MCKACYQEGNVPVLTKHIVVEEKEVAEAGPVQGEDPDKEDMLANRAKNHALLFYVLFCCVDYSTYSIQGICHACRLCFAKRMSSS